MSPESQKTPSLSPRRIGWLAAGTVLAGILATIALLKNAGVDAILYRAF